MEFLVDTINSYPGGDGFVVCKGQGVEFGIYHDQVVIFLLDEDTRNDLITHAMIYYQNHVTRGCTKTNRGS